MAFYPEDWEKGPLGARESQGKSKDEKAEEANPLILFIFRFFGNPFILTMNNHQSHSILSYTCTTQTQRRREKVLRTKLRYKSLPK